MVFNVYQISYEYFCSYLSSDTCRTCNILPSLHLRLHSKDMLLKHISRNDTPHFKVAPKISMMSKEEDFHSQVWNHYLMDLDLLFRCRATCQHGQEHAWWSIKECTVDNSCQTLRCQWQILMWCWFWEVKLMRSKLQKIAGLVPSICDKHPVLFCLLDQWKWKWSCCTKSVQVNHSISLQSCFLCAYFTSDITSFETM